MFFIYVIIFIAIVATPFVVQSGWWIFSEDEMEALALLVAGVVSFGIYRLRDYQFFQTITDRMHIQRLFARAQRDLSESYSYIGQANRKNDIVYDIFSDLRIISLKNYADIVARIMQLLPYVHGYDLHVMTRDTHERLVKIHRLRNTRLEDALFERTTNLRTYIQHDVMFVYSELPEHNIRVCLAVHNSDKVQEDTQLFHAITAYLLMAHSLRYHALHKSPA